MGHGRFCRVLSRLWRRGGGTRPRPDRSGLAHTHDRCLRRHFRRTCRLCAALSPVRGVTVIVPLGIIFYPFALSAIWVVGFWFLMQLLSAAFSNPHEPGVAWWAHVGGFATGLLLTPFFKSSRFPLLGRPQPGPWARLIRRWHGFRSYIRSPRACRLRSGANRHTRPERMHMKHQETAICSLAIGAGFRAGRDVPDQSGKSIRGPSNGCSRRSSFWMGAIRARPFTAWREQNFVNASDSSCRARVSMRIVGKRRHAIGSCCCSSNPLQMKQPLWLSAIGTTSNCAMLEMETVLLAPLTFGARRSPALSRHNPVSWRFDTIGRTLHRL